MSTPLQPQIRARAGAGSGPTPGRRGGSSSRSEGGGCGGAATVWDGEEAAEGIAAWEPPRGRGQGRGGGRRGGRRIGSAGCGRAARDRHGRADSRWRQGSGRGICSGTRRGTRRGPRTAAADTFQVYPSPSSPADHGRPGQQVPNDRRGATTARLCSCVRTRATSEASGSTLNRPSYADAIRSADRAIVMQSISMCSNTEGEAIVR